MGTETRKEMRSVADFRSALVAGSQWRCDHHREGWRGTSGVRTITGGKGVFSYSFENADGRTGTNGRMALPKASQLRIDGESVHFLDESGAVAWTWTRL